MTKPALTKFNRMIEYSSIALGVVLGVIYLDPMTINSTKSDLRSSVKSISQYDALKVLKQLSQRSISKLLPQQNLLPTSFWHQTKIAEKRSYIRIFK